MGEEFHVRFLNPAVRTDGQGRPVLDLTPTAPTPLLTHLVIALDSKDLVVRQAMLYDQLQDTVTMTFARLAINGGADALFALPPPPGAAVVPLDQR